MHKNTKFLSLESTRAWISQFQPEDQEAAAELIRELRLVSRDEFAERLRSLILTRIAAEDGVVGLYAEREIRLLKGVPNRLFSESKRKIRRAEGSGPLAVSPLRRYEQEVGSEGLVANLITEICQKNPKKILSHPGPDQIRAKKVRRFLLVTDFIGSGDRAYTYLQSAWLVRSVRSWWSARATKGMAFEVISYSGTCAGIQRVENHRCKPKVSIVAACPTVLGTLSYERRKAAYTLCRKYDPLGDAYTESLGYGRVGALMAFAHGIPNNAPRMLYKAGKSWFPLFPKRRTSPTKAVFESEVGSVESVRSALLALRQKRMAESSALTELRDSSRMTLLLLAALSVGSKADHALSERTGLTVLEIQQLIDEVTALGWVTGTRHLTESGIKELNAARKLPVAGPLPKPAQSHYYPSMLRAPVGSSS